MPQQQFKRNVIGAHWTMRPETASAGSSTETQEHNRIAAVKDLTSIVQAIAVVISLIIGGFVFILKGEMDDKLKLTMTVAGGERVVVGDLCLIHVSIRMENFGKFEASLYSAQVVVRQIHPLSFKVTEKLKTGLALLNDKSAKMVRLADKEKAEADWPILANSGEVKLANTRMEAGEVEELVFDFALPVNIDKVRVVGAVKLQEESRKHWQTSTDYALSKCRRGVQ